MNDRNKRQSGKTAEIGLGGRPEAGKKLNLVTATPEQIAGVVNQVSHERADSVHRYMQFSRSQGTRYSSVREFLGNVPGFGPKLIGAFDLFCELDYDEQPQRAEQPENAG